MNTFDRRPRHRSNNGFRRRKYSSYTSNNSSIDQNHTSNTLPNHSGFRVNGRFGNNAVRLAEKYNILAREALVQGDRVAAENFFQHADHFTRLIQAHDDYNLKKLNVEQSIIINKIPGIHLDLNEEDTPKNTSDDGANQTRGELNK